MIFSAKQLMSIFGSNFIETGASILIILVIAQFINSMTGGVASTLNMTGKQNLEMLNSVALVAINIVLNCFLIPLYGGLGAAIATSISITIINLLRILEVYIVHAIHPYSMSYVKGIVSGVTAVIILLFLGEYFPNQSNLIGLVLNSFIVGLIFSASFAIAGIDNGDKYILDVLAKKTKLLWFLNNKGRSI